MGDMQTMVRSHNFSSKETLRIIKENCTTSPRIFLRAYKVSDTLMILAVEYEKLEKEREAFAQENTFSKTKSVSPTQVTCRRCEETGTQEPWGNNQCHHDQCQERRMLPTDGKWPAI